MNKILVISGPTAAGKTALAVKIAKKLHGELISADSRQIYQDLDIGVGKDHPQNTKIHLIDLITPNETFSVAQYQQLALPTIKKLQHQNILPILVGCSGLYIDSIINPQANYSVKPNSFLRLILNRLPLKTLQFIFNLLDFRLYALLNNSDVNNPRRLIRKIELKISSRLPITDYRLPNFDILHLSLTSPNDILYARIDSRVEERLKIGHLKELRNLLKKYRWSDTGLKISCYQVFKQYFDKKSDLKDSIQKWKYLEHRDARHQKTWFSKRKNIHLYDINDPEYPRNLLHFVDQWYNKP